MRCALLLLALLPLASACRSDCSPAARPRLDIGTGEREYVPLDPEAPSWDLVHGPQGGWHVVLGFDAAGLDATQVVTGELVGRIDGEVVARQDRAWLTFQCDPEDQSLQTSNVFLIFGVEDHCGLDGKTLDVEATVPAADGEPVTGTASGEILDPEWASCE